MKKIYLLLFTLIPYVINAQQGSITVSGTILDQDSKTPLEYATISLFNVNDSIVKYGGISDLNGKFNLEINRGNYDIKLNYISFKEVTINNVMISKTKDLGNILMSIDENILDEIELIGERTEVEIKLDKTVYNIGKDLTLRGSSVSDVLDNLPSVAVDIDGNVSLRGNQSVRILINGKPSGLVGISSNDALKQFPSESVEKVEIITSPSARYDAEGTAGIINIVLRKNKLAGLNGSISTNLGDPKSYGFSGNINYRTKKINLFTNAGYSLSSYENPSYSETEYFTTKPINNFIKENSNRNTERDSYYQNTGIEYFFSDKTSLVVSYLTRKSDDKDITNNNINQNFQREKKSSIRSEVENESDDTKEFSINFTHEFKNKGNITMDFQKEKSNEIEIGIITNTQSVPNFIKYLGERVNTNENQDSELYKIDYVLPLGDDGQFELGFRRSNRYQITDYLVEDENLNGEFIKNTNLSNNLYYNEKINAFYTQYGNKKNKLSFLFGLRFEESLTNVKQFESNSNSNKKYNDFFPTINLAYELKENESITLGYNRRISRPRSYFINPFPSRTSETSFFQGNPYLNPTYSNGIDLGYLKRLNKTTLNGSVYYKKSNEIFTFITEATGNSVLVNDILVPVIRRSPINLSSQEEIGIEFNTNYSHSKNWRIGGNINFYQSNVVGSYNEIVYNSKNLIWSGRLNNYLKIFSSIDWQTRLSYRGPQKNAISTRKASVSTNTAFSKDIFNDKMTLTFKINDIFETQNWRLETFSETYKNYTESSWRGGRSFNLSLIYRFNQKKSQTNNRSNYEDYGGEGFGG
ncbi:MAG: TonB-dependent receptor [Flavobacteriaceae bacterium]|nr:TonB-dependent receptor [Flavobacteriaceae bacterium]